MASTLTIEDSSVDTNLVTITFSDDVEQNTGDTTDALNPANYLIYDPPVYPTPAPFLGTVNAVDGQTISFVPSPPFKPGDFVLITVGNIALASDPGVPALVDSPVSIAQQVPGKGRVARLTRDVEDAVAYPILTEQVGYNALPSGVPYGGGMSAGGSSNLGQLATKAVSDVLGWKANTTDPKGFIGALTQAFTLTDVEGHVESTWTPRTYTVQTDLGGGITGAQASLYTRAKDALDQSLRLLDGLYPLDPEADPEYVKALREMARSQMTEIVKEFGVVGLPSILRIDTYFGILLGQSPAQISGNQVQFDPDQIGGTLGELRNTYGIQFIGNPFNNSVEDEQDITNFRVISDYMTSLMQSWIANRQFFIIAPNNPAFFGTQLVLISRQFNVITETVNELRFALDSVFIGPNERQTLLLEFSDPSLTPMFLEDVLSEVEKFATDEGPRLLRDGGKISVTNNILPVVVSLQNMVEQAHSPANIHDLPDGFRTARVRNALDDLQDQLQALVDLTEQVEQQVPPAEGTLLVSRFDLPSEENGGMFSFFGDGFDPGTTVTIDSSVPVNATVEFYSAQRIDASLSDPLENGSHDITITNSAGQSVTLANAFTFNNGIFTRSSKVIAKAAKVRKSAPGRLPARAPAAAGRRPTAPGVKPHTPSGPTAPPRTSARSSPGVAGSRTPLEDLLDSNRALSQKLDALTSTMATLAATISHASATSPGAAPPALFPPPPAPPISAPASGTLPTTSPASGPAATSTGPAVPESGAPPAQSKQGNPKKNIS